LHAGVEGDNNSGSGKNENFAKLAPKDKAEQKIATSKEMYANYFDSEYAPGAVSAFYC